MRRCNEWLAARATVAFGSVWACYLFLLYGLAPLVWPQHMAALLYGSNAIQLVSLPLLMVGSNVLGRAAERRALADHKAIMAELTELRRIRALLEAGAGLKGVDPHGNPTEPRRAGPPATRP